ncbi:paraquat-inducible protein A [Cupriavidus pauculus]|nr:paraquat-inducible protein A [Cupriavidus pauculus]
MIACRHCDAIHQCPPVSGRDHACCLRCGTKLYRGFRHRHRYIVPLVLAALVVLLVSIVFPIAHINLRGAHTETTIWGVIEVLCTEPQLLPIAALIVVTIVVFPLAELLLVLYLLVQVSLRRKPRDHTSVIKHIRLCRSWGMLDVLVISVLVMLVKLSTFAHVSPDIAFWSYVLLMILLAASVAFDPQELWDYLQEE